MTSDRIHEIFKLAGKLIHFGDIGETYANGVKDHLLATQDQFVAASGAQNPFNELVGFFGPMLRSGQQIAQTLDRLPLVAKSAMDNYLRVIGLELSQATGTPPATILAALAAQMSAHTETVAPSGQLYLFFRDAYGVSLPQNDAPTIADNLITTSIV